MKKEDIDAIAKQVAELLTKQQVAKKDKLGRKSRPLVNDAMYPVMLPKEELEEFKEVCDYLRIRRSEYLRNRIRELLEEHRAKMSRVKK